ncbi:hypothetical protein [Kaistia terrae]|uniref:Uncharacterized protein n=1 Tax=Kaistia terrae TaxID=537017 RepID=A0ABW0Q3T4_9HYPH|nr:hypothetical protein [Kaistia terrae]MCX5581524.1 hypothetical protein [Kaistia terrae]
MDLQSLSDDELRDLYSRTQGGGGGGAPDTSWADHLPVAGSGKDQSHLEPMQARPLGSPGSQGVIPNAGPQQQYPPSVGAGSTGRVSGVFDDIAAQTQRPELQAGLEAKAGASSLQDMSDDDLIALHQQAKGPGAGITRNVAAGMNNALYATAGAPVDAMTWALNKGVQGINAATGANLSEIQNPIGGSQSIANAFGTIGVDDPANVQAHTTGERIARGVGEGIGYTVGPQVAVGGLARGGALAPETAAKAYQLLGWPNSTAAVAGNAVAGGAAGGGSVAAMEATPDRYDPLSGLAGGMAGGAVGTMASGLPRLANEGVRIAGDMVAPMTRGGRERIAADTIRNASTDRHAVAEALSNPGEMVPGSQPTTFQQTGDMGLGALERRYATQDPVAFNQRRADQNSARLDSLGTIQPEGNPQAITQAFRFRLADIDRQTDAALKAALQNARGKTQALGGNGSAETYGDTLRTFLRDAETTARDSERSLWKAVDPEGKLALQSDNVKSTAADIRKEMPETAKPMDGEEAAIFKVAGELKPVISFNAMSALRARVSTLMRQEMMTNGQTPIYARLSRLRGAVEQDVEGVLAQKAAQEADAVAAGTMREEDTIAAMLRRDQEAWYDRQAAEAGMGQSVGAVGGRDAPIGSRSVPSARRGEVPGRGQFRDAAGDQGVPGDVPLTPNFDDAARGRLITASTGTKQRARDFNDGANGSILRRSGGEGPYRLQNAAVPEKLFFPGGRSAENIKRFRKAVGDDRAMGHLQGFAVAQMRKAAETPDGIIDPKRLEAWKRRHGEALKAFPTLEAKFADVAKASQTAIDAGASRAAQLDDFQKGVFGKLIGAEHPDDITRMVGSVFGRQDASAMMGQLARTVSGNPEAIQGLRKSVVDHMLGRLVSNTEAATSGRALLKSDQFQSFIKQNRAALKRIFGDHELGQMQAIADDLQRANRSITAVKLPGGSNTPQDMLAAAKGDSRKTILSKLAVAALGSTAGGLGGGAIAILGANAVTAARKAGLNSIDDLVRDALLHPDRAALLLSTRPFEPGTGPAVALMKRYNQASITGAATTHGDGPGGADRNDPLQVTVTQPANWPTAQPANRYEGSGGIIDELSGGTDYAKALGLDR